MWKPLSIVSGVALLAGGGIIYSMVRPVLVAERLQLTNAAGYKEKADKLKLDAGAAVKVAEKELEKVKESLTKAERAKADAAAKKDEIAKAVDEASATKENAAKDLSEIEAKMKDLGGLDAMVAELRAQEAKRIEYSKQIAAAKADIDSALTRKTSLDKTIADIKRLDLWQQTGTMAPSFRSRVTAVNPDWGFVTIGAGNGSSVVRQAKLDVFRGSSVVGKLVVTHVSPNSSAAEIVPGSVAPGDSILPGDQVKTGRASLPSNIPANPTPSTKLSAAPNALKPASPVLPAEAVPSDPFAPPLAAPPATPSPAAEAPATQP